MRELGSRLLVIYADGGKAATEVLNTAAEDVAPGYTGAWGDPTPDPDEVDPEEAERLEAAWAQVREAGGGVKPDGMDLQEESMGVIP